MTEVIPRLAPDEEGDGQLRVLVALISFYSEAQQAPAIDFLGHRLNVNGRGRYPRPFPDPLQYLDPGANWVEVELETLNVDAVPQVVAREIEVEVILIKGEVSTVRSRLICMRL